MALSALCLLFVGILAQHSYSFELITRPESATVPQGNSHTLSCESDEPYEVCKWHHTEDDRSCRVISDEVESSQGTECKGERHIIWDLTETNCGIIIHNAARSDVGEWKCTLGIMKDEVTFAGASASIDVSVPAIVTFEGTFAYIDTQVELGTEQIVHCKANGAYPEPELQAAIGEGKDHFADEGEDTLLEMVDEQRSQLPDGTWEVTKSFKFTAQRDHCGQHLKCEAIQKDEEGNILFPEQEVMSRKINIVFGPLPLDDQLPPVTFRYGAEDVRIDIVFAAHPLPADNEAIWHINPSGDASHHSHVLQAGHSEEDGKYVAERLNDTGLNHEVRATLIIKNPSFEDLDPSNYLEVSTTRGMQRYDFELELDTTPIKPTERVTPNHHTKGMGVGTVVAIVIVIIVICLIIGCVVYAKRAGKCCFEKYNSVPVKPDHPGDSHEHTSIIKNGGGMDGMKTKAVEAGVDETDENKHEHNHENPV